MEKNVDRLKKALSFVLILAFLAACAPATPTPTEIVPVPTDAPTATDVPPTATTEPTATEAPTATATAEPVVLGPDSFPAGVNPLTGLEVDDPGRLERRPVIVKVQNIPRGDRPQYGVSLADLVFEYYTEEGATRFAAVFYGQDAETVAPIRSGRFFDIHLVQMYKGVFVFGSAYEVLRDRLFSSEFANRLVIEASRWQPAVKRFDPNRRNYLSVDTAALQAALKANNVENNPQDLNGMMFAQNVPAGGRDVATIFNRYSAAIYNRWDYDEATGTYLRFSDVQNDTQGGKAEKYEQLTDALTEEPIAVENLVTLIVPHEIRDPRAGTEVVDMQLFGQGPAYIARDGKLYEVQWQRLQPDSVLTLVDADGNLFPFKPGQTWFEIMSRNTQIQDNGDNVRFTFVQDW
jgi:hypothetical protein